MKKLNRNNVTNKANPIKIMQFGAGNFLRGFADWMIDIANERTNFNAGVAVIKPTEKGNYNNLKAQDGLFHTLLRGVENGELINETRLVQCIQKVINPYLEWEEYLALAKTPELRFIISNTTESGITYDEKGSAAAQPPHEFPAKLTRWLHVRYLHFNGAPSKGCILLPCELIENNGEILRDCILKYASLWQLGDKFYTWVKESNFFCNTLVDRIVSGFPTEESSTIQEELGYEDKMLVAGEYYHSWLIKVPNPLVRQELPFERVGLKVKFVNDLKPYRDMKVRLLNGAHTAMVPLGILSGITTVKEAMEDGLMSWFIHKLLYQEIIPTIDFTQSECEAFAIDVIDRFSNPFVKHRLMSIALNSISKFNTRLLGSMKDYIGKYRKLPVGIIMSLSALILLYKGEYDGNKIGLKDDPKYLELFKKMWKLQQAGTISTKAMVHGLLSERLLWGEDLTIIDGLVDKVTANLDNLEVHGVSRTLEETETIYEIQS